jgi:hypothetical protein
MPFADRSVGGNRVARAGSAARIKFGGQSSGIGQALVSIETTSFVARSYGFGV